MWKRKELKAYAKSFLRKNYWTAFFAVLLTMILTGGIGSSLGSNLNVAGTFNIDTDDDYEEVLFEEEQSVVETTEETESSIRLFEEDSTMGKVLLTLGIGGVVIVFLLIVAFIVMVGFVVEVGQSRFFLDGFKGDVDVGKILSGFNAEEYKPIVRAQLRAEVQLFLWTLLFIIPGIIKTYAYRYVPYVLAEDPTLSSKEAIAESISLTNGHKWDIFVLDLSFIWWNMLAFFTFGISNLFVAPYKVATNAVLYKVLSNPDDLEPTFEQIPSDFEDDSLN